MRSRWVLAGTLLAVSGCYRYVSSEPSALTAGSVVTVELTSAGTANVRPAIGDFATAVEGNVTEATGAGLTLSLVSVRRRGEVQPSTWKGESIHLAPGDIDGVRIRTFSRGRTTAAVVALGAASVGLVIAIARATGILEVSGSGGKPIPPP